MVGCDFGGAVKSGLVVTVGDVITPASTFQYISVRSSTSGTAQQMSERHDSRRNLIVPETDRSVLFSDVDLTVTVDGYLVV